MVFNNKNELRKFYTNYAREEGFGMTTRSSNIEDNGKLKYITLTSTLSGKSHRTTRNPLQLQPLKKTDCKVKVNASACPNGKFRLTTIVLEHNRGFQLKHRIKNQTRR